MTTRTRQNCLKSPNNLSVEKYIADRMCFCEYCNTATIFQYVQSYGENPVVLDQCSRCGSVYGEDEDFDFADMVNQSSISGSGFGNFKI